VYTNYIYIFYLILRNISKNLKKSPSMAESSSPLPPLCERISHKSYFLRAVDLTILGLLLSLLLYRILHVNQKDTVWIVAFLCETCFTFVWLLITNIKWSPADYKTYPERLDERYHFPIYTQKAIFLSNLYQVLIYHFILVE